MINSQFYCQSSNGFYPDSNDCAYYYLCSGGIPHHIMCPTGTLWDQSVLTCNHASVAECYTRYSCPEPEGLFPVDDDCGKYLNCYENIPYIQECPVGLHFNPDALLCDYPMEANCQSNYRK
ncbi:hypothetical protein LOTGIDRAFT_140112 [Lottia gigantea]|uniref:Chitin-binding type-2 domain-containing protein n=1 Tax=Lottia gigantea TaxID=225164 RepID=V4B111_LOTGI|nr:hypothetical protein LOTGIDRAFT_140112 [Lottia gigantea]ESP00986.1 hypothetical protein LOTGIDRAFT_140112 [Lottia gigantea]